MATWLVTGASSGLGAALSRAVLERGHNAIVTARRASSVKDLVDRYPQAALAVALDVTDTSTITTAIAAAEARFGGIDVLVNNAGYGYTAAVEEGDTDDVARLFATNVFGPIDLIKAALPGMRSRGTGSIVNISSVGARITIAGGGYYAAAKAALEGLSGSLRKEIEPLGLHVVVVEPGSFRTEFRGRSADKSNTRITAYDEVLGRTGEQALGPQRGDPVKAAAAIIDAVTHSEPPQLLVLGTDALTGFHTSTEEAARDVTRFEHLSRSTDADN